MRRTALIFMLSRAAQGRWSLPKAAIAQKQSVSCQENACLVGAKVVKVKKKDVCQTLPRLRQRPCAIFARYG